MRGTAKLLTGIFWMFAAVTAGLSPALHVCSMSRIIGEIIMVENPVDDRDAYLSVQVP
jgi:hypothetical protein